MSEKFNLKWNDFQTNVSKSFGLFRNEEYLHDVTLVTDDFNQVKAHKLVLSACSDYFKKLLLTINQAQPHICLDGVNSVDLKNVLDYVYEGEVKIHQEDLDRFLILAQKLQLQGLIGATEDEEDKPEKLSSNIDHDVIEDETGNYKTDIETPGVRKNRVYNKGGIVAIPSDDQDQKQMIDENIIINEDGSVSCKICGKKSNEKQKMHYLRQHMETHIEGKSFSCPVCQKSFRSKNSLSNHKSLNHR